MNDYDTKVSIEDVDIASVMLRSVHCEYFDWPNKMPEHAMRRYCEGSKFSKQIISMIKSSQFSDRIPESYLKLFTNDMLLILRSEADKLPAFKDPKPKG